MKSRCILCTIALIAAVVSCKNSKMPDKEISTINNKIIYYEIQYQSTLYYENGEIKEKDKTKIITRYFDENNNVIKELPAAYNISYNIYEYD
ncbi:MAG: hypothetical protein LBK64_02920, partial [Spirochaetaceae bacterium]|nr:hypothetical protein [Spirochaetaceae bacterium]